MTNLIERLKHFAKGGSGPINDTCAQAVNEIERLQRQVNHLEDLVAGYKNLARQS